MRIYTVRFADNATMQACPLSSESDSLRVVFLCAKYVRLEACRNYLFEAKIIG